MSFLDNSMLEGLKMWASFIAKEKDINKTNFGIPQISEWDTSMNWESDDDDEDDDDGDDDEDDDWDEEEDDDDWEDDEDDDDDDDDEDLN